jgi:hypothetical protein
MLKAPRHALQSGVRAVDTMTASLMKLSGEKICRDGALNR